MLCGLAALPLSALAVASCVRRISPEEEALALTAGGRGFAWRRVYWPHLRQGIGWALVATAVVTAGEVTVPDFCVVRTAAEEVYTAFVLGESLPGATWAALPTTLLVTALAALTLSRLEAPWRFDARPQPGPGGGRLAWGVLAVLVAVPVGRLVWQLGDAPGGFSPGRAWGQWRAWADVRTGLLLGSAAEALAVGLAAALVTLAWAWLGRTSPAWRWAGLSLAVLWWALPAPVLGYGLKSAIGSVVAAEERLSGPFGPLAEWLYYGPSPLPGMVARLGRALPWAALVVFPAVAALPQISLELARVEGLSPRAAWRAWVRPALGGPLLLGACLAGLAAFGEVSASAVVAPAGSESYTAEVFRQMHYGTSAAVAAAALHPWLLFGLLAAAAIWRTAPRSPRG